MNETLVAFVATSAVLVVLPGPNVVYIVARGLAHGRRAAVASTLGVEAGMLVHIAAAGTGLSALLTRTAVTFTTIKLVGAGYLLFLAVRALRGDGADAPAGAPSGPPAVAPGGRLFLQGFWVSVLNPKVAVFFLAFLPQFVRPGHGPVLAQTLVLGSVFLAVATVSDLAYALVSGTAGGRVARVVRRRPRRRRYVEAAVYVGLGAAVATTGSSDR